MVRRIQVSRPRVRSKSGEEASLPHFEAFREEDPLPERVLNQILVGVSTRNYESSLDKPAGLLHHSDQGSPYASEDYQRLLETHGMTGSMRRRGNCYDNAVIESWFSTLKHELGEHFLSCGEAKMALFDFIEVFYNQRRRHSTLGQVSPAEFERRMMTSTA